MRVYIIGPMRGYPQLNYPAFSEAESMLADAGHEVVNPAKLCSESMSIRDIARKDIHELLRCDAVFVLPGWSGSIGARAELMAASFAEMQIVLHPAAEDSVVMLVDLKEV